MSHPISRILYREDASRRPGDDHPSGRTIAGRLKQLPANSGEKPSNIRAHARCACFLPCSQWGLPSHGSHLPCWCALNAPFYPYQENPGGLLSVALARRSPWVAVSNHRALWSPDFPRPRASTLQQRRCTRPRSSRRLIRENQPTPRHPRIHICMLMRGGRGPHLRSGHGQASTPS